ncbi:MAG: family transporter [Phycisphaerales bacterium]|nr:family transporter [Phycisphaerales bacterium]
MSESSASPGWVRRATALFVWAVVLAIFFTFFNAITTVLLGVLAASIVACALGPLLRFLPVPRGIAAGLVGLGFIAAAGGLVLAWSLPLAGPITRQLKSLPDSSESLDALLAKWSASVPIFHQRITTADLLTNLREFFFSSGSLIVAGGFLAILLWVAFVFVGSIFLLASPRDVLLGPAIRIVPPRHRPDVDAMFDQLGNRLRWWMIGTLGGMTVVFSASCIGYFASGLKFALPLALLAGLAEIIPTVGPAVAAIVALLFAMSQSNSAAVGVIITYVVIQSLEAYLILPLIMRGAVKIHPAITLFSVVLWAKIFGVPGMVLAIPINLTIGSAIEYLYIRPRERRDARSRRGEVNEPVEAGVGPP